MRKIKSALLSPIYQGTHTRAVNSDARRALSRKNRKKKKLPPDVVARRNERVHKRIEAQREIAAEILARLVPSAESGSQSGCVFCQLDRKVIAESRLSIAFFDNFPISKGHALIVSKRHVRSLWSMTNEEYIDAFSLVRRVKEFLDKQYAPAGFNVGVNCGEAAGQTIWHAHIHVIPRYPGDLADPRGGIRRIFPKKAKYW